MLPLYCDPQLHLPLRGRSDRSALPPRRRFRQENGYRSSGSIPPTGARLELLATALTITDGLGGFAGTHRHARGGSVRRRTGLPRRDRRAEPTGFGACLPLPNRYTTRGQPMYVPSGPRRNRPPPRCTTSSSATVSVSWSRKSKGAPFATHISLFCSTAPQAPNGNADRARRAGQPALGANSRPKPRWPCFSGPHAYISPTWYEAAKRRPDVELRRCSTPPAKQNWSRTRAPFWKSFRGA